MDVENSPLPDKVSHSFEWDFLFVEYSVMLVTEDKIKLYGKQCIVWRRFRPRQSHRRDSFVVCEPINPLGHHSRLLWMVVRDLLGYRVPSIVICEIERGGAGRLA